MNYISHYYTSIQQSEIQRVGNLLPDIFPKFSYYRNKNILPIDKTKWPHDSIELWKGVENHYRVDAIFHSLPSFDKYTKLIIKKMEESPNLKHISRKYAVAHVLYELILDQMVIKAHPEILDLLYKDIQNLDSALLTNFIHYINLSQENADLYHDSFINFYKNQFLYFYKDNSRIVKALYFVTGKIGNWENTEKVAKDFEKIIVELNDEINLEKIFENVVS